MESSSDDSFLWTDASSDSSSDKMVAGKKEHGKIKTNIDNDIDGLKKKKKAKYTSDSEKDLQSSMSYHDVDFLNSKVKLEGSSDVTPPPQHELKKTKRKKLRENKKIKESQLSADTNILTRDAHHTIEDQNPDFEDFQEVIVKTKKNKKLKRKFSSDNDNYTDNHIKIDTFTAEETVVGLKQKLQYETGINVSLQNGTFREHRSPENSDEGSCDEISAIKGDDDHILETTTLSVKSVQKELHMAKRSHHDSDKSTNCVDIPKLSIQKHRSPRISDRIRFEDEVESENEESSQNHYVSKIDKPNSKMSTQVKHYLKTNFDLKPLTNSISTGNVLTMDDDIWLVKCTKEIDISGFNNVNLKLDGKCKLKICGHSFDSVAKVEDSSCVTVLTMEDSKYQIKSLGLSGVITLKKRIPKPHFIEDNVMVNDQTNFIPLPETKCRHPLFGSNYKRALKIPSSIAERLCIIDKEQLSEGTQARKKKKLNKDKRKTVEVYPNIDTEITQSSLKTEPELTSNLSQKKKKRKNNDYADTPKKKLFKHDPESAEAWESEKAIEENLFNF